MQILFLRNQTLLSHGRIPAVPFLTEVKMGISFGRKGVIDSVEQHRLFSNHIQIDSSTEVVSITQVLPYLLCGIPSRNTDLKSPQQVRAAVGQKQFSERVRINLHHFLSLPVALIHSGRQARKPSNILQATIWMTGRLSWVCLISCFVTS